MVLQNLIEFLLYPSSEKKLKNSKYKFYCYFKSMFTSQKFSLKILNFPGALVAVC